MDNQNNPGGTTPSDPNQGQSEPTMPGMPTGAPADDQSGQVPAEPGPVAPEPMPTPAPSDQGGAPMGDQGMPSAPTEPQNGGGEQGGGTPAV